MTGFAEYHNNLLFCWSFCANQRQFKLYVNIILVLFSSISFLVIILRECYLNNNCINILCSNSNFNFQLGGNKACCYCYSVVASQKIIEFNQNAVGNYRFIQHKLTSTTNLEYLFPQDTTEKVPKLSYLIYIIMYWIIFDNIHLVYQTQFIVQIFLKIIYLFAHLLYRPKVPHRFGGMQDKACNQDGVWDSENVWDRMWD